MRRLIFLFAGFSAFPAFLQAQSSTQLPRLFVDDAPSTAIRMAALRDSSIAPAVLWRGSTYTMSDRGFVLYPFSFRLEGNSGYVSDRNNGSLWGGRGINAQAAGGVRVRFGAFSAAVAPEVNVHQNMDLETLPGMEPLHPLGNPFSAWIDLPQRFGEKGYASISPGQSFVRGDFGAAGLGVSTENLWWGPGLRESIVLSNSAEGFPHAFAETNRPIDIGFAQLGVSAFWGRLSESDYYDSIPDNDHRLFTGAGLTLQPHGAENLTLGLTRLFTYPVEGISAKHFVPFFAPVLKDQIATPENPSGDDPDDQRLSVFAHYRLPSEGFEVYGEYGREDHSWDFRDLIGEPEHSAAYLIGFQRLTGVTAGRQLRVQGEWVNLQGLRAHSLARTTPTTYVHYPQGHTQRGQMLGAGIGPGAEAQFLAVDVLKSGSALGGYVERVRREETSPPALASRETWPPRHDLELTAGMRGFRRTALLALSAQLSYSFRMERSFIEDASNVRLVLQATYSPLPGAR